MLSPMGYESIVKAKALNWLSEVLTYEYIVAEKKGYIASK
jgi:hypothetical protein